MATISVVKELRQGENRVATTPAAVARFRKLGLKVAIEAGAGSNAGFLDEEYCREGAKIGQRKAVLAEADVILTLSPLPECDLNSIRPCTLLVGRIQPFSRECALERYAQSGLEVIALELLPRTTRAQAMDILSSQSNLAGYHAIARASVELNRCLPMMSTAAGSILAAKAFVMGVGVAGLQAIATARRLGAAVSATDVRPETREQILSLGAKPIFEDIRPGDEVTAGQGGYAGEMSEGYRARQSALITRHILSQDIVVTTALIPGRRAPILLTDPQIAQMKPGSVIVDLAAESGGNVEGSCINETVQRHGVKIIGLADGASRLAHDASNLFARNCYNFIEAFWDKTDMRMSVPPDEPLLESARLTRGGAIVNPRFDRATVTL